MVKFTYEYVKEFFEKNGYTLLDTEYKNSRTQMNAICPIGHKITKSYASIRNGINCKMCNVLKPTTPKIPFSEVKEQIESRGYKIVSQKYINAGEKMDLICPGGHNYSTNFSDFKTGRGCKICSIEKTKVTNLQRYGVEYVAQLDSVKKKIRESVLKKYGVKYATQSEIVRQKTKTTNLRKYGVEHVFQSKTIREKIRKSVFEKYGVDYILQLKSFHDKIKITNLKKYGVSVASKSEIVKQKTINTNLKKYGAKYYFQSSDYKKIKKTLLDIYGIDYPAKLLEIRRKAINTCLKKYGVEYVGQCEQIKEKIRQTCLRRYGVDNPFKCLEIRKKILRSSFKRKPYTFPSGKVVYVQGYEPFCLDMLLKMNYTDSHIICGDISSDEGINIPIIDYIREDGKSASYFPDIYIPVMNIIIEVKSQYTYDKEKERNILKMKATANSGYNIYLYIFDKIGTLIYGDFYPAI